MAPGFTLTLIYVLKAICLALGYLTNSSFPKPLGEEEEAVFLQRLQAGDNEARNILVEHNLRLVAHITRKFESTGEDPDDLISIGTIGLIKAINSYDLNKGTKLATYAARCIENEVLMHLRSIKKQRGEISLYDPIGVDKEGNEITLFDVLGTDSDTVVDTVEADYECKRVISKMQRLSKREKHVLELRFGLANGFRKTQREIAKRLGISRSYVSRIEKKAIQKLLKEMSEV